MAEHKHTNRLIHETSPYLLQHAHNPVDWFPWGNDALTRARAEQKPILLSVGYSACHWCHVMEHESFENEEIAALMNELFVCIKVDREERPDIDHIYMTAVQMLTGQGGWPMTVFLTPEGKPFYGGTYFPPTDVYGRPGFPRVLQAVAEAWGGRRAEVEGQANGLSDQIRNGSMIDLPAAPILPEMFSQAFGALQQSFDNRFGGFGGAPKFPQPMILDFLLRYSHRSNRSEPLRMAELTLEKMAFGGMYDQIGGGFHRYSTDEYWLVPHFEKMLYDNAQLAQTYLRTFQATRDPLYERITTQILDYVLREMTHPSGGFYSAQDADSEGVEGKFFVWTPAEVRAILGPEDAEIFCSFYNITDRGNFDEGKSIPNITIPLEAFARGRGEDPKQMDSRLNELRARLFAEREKRVKPFRDEKILTAWNGMMLAAMAEAASALGNDAYREAAIRCAEFILAELYIGDKQRGARRLMRTGKHNGAFKVAPIPGFLEDYACFADGLLRLYEATFDMRWLESARVISDQMIELFADPNGGFFNTATDAEELIDRPRDVMDNAVPSGNSVAVDILLRLSVTTGDKRYHDRAAPVLRKMAQALERHPQAFGRLLCAADFFVGPVHELAVIGPAADVRTQALLTRARAAFRPNLVIAQSNEADGGIQLPLLEGRAMLNDTPTAYVCQNYACKQPTTEPDELARQLDA